MWSTIWEIANSPAGMLVISTIVGLLFKKAVKSESRRDAILGYANQAFDLVELYTRTTGVKGYDKYLKFMKLITESLDAAKMAPLSEEEKRALTELANRKAYITKPPTGAPYR